MKLSSSLHLLIVVLIYLGLPGCSGQEKEAGGTEIVAKVGSRTITLEDLERAYEKTPPSLKKGEGGLENLTAFLETMVQKELLAQAAEDSIRELTPRQKIRLDRRTDNIISEIIEEEEVRPDLEVADAEIDELYEKRKIGYRPRHILVKSLAEANEIMTLLSEGAVFEALAMQMSIDRRTYANGGDMGLLLAGDTDPDFEAALFNMKVGETVGPVKTVSGYHIIRLEDQREVQVPPLDDDLRERLKLMILTRRAIDRKEAFLDRIKKKVGVKYHPEAVRLLDRRFTALWANEEFLGDPTSIGSPGVDPSLWFPEFAEEDYDLPLFTFGDSTIVLGEWIEKMHYAPAIMWPKGGGDEWVRKHLDDTYYKEIVIAYGRSEGMRNDPEVLRRRELAREEILVNTFYRTRIDTVSPPREEDVWKYYQDNLLRYSLPEDLVQASLFYFNDEDAAAEAVERWEGGATDNEVYMEYHQAGTLTEWRPSERLLKESAEAELFDACWELEGGDFFGPLTIFGDYIVGRMEGKTAAGPIPWEYAKERVGQDLLAARKEARLQEVIENLKTKYPVEVHAEVLAGSKLAAVEAG